MSTSPLALPLVDPMDDLLSSAPCGLFSFTDDGVLVAVNETLLEVLGYARDELLGRHVEQLLSLASRMFYETHFFPLIRMHGRAQELSLALRSRTGESVPVLVNAVRKARQGGVVNHCAFMPVRERAKYEDELLKAKWAAEEALLSNEELTRARQALEQQARELEQKLRMLERRNQQLTRVSTILSHDLREPARKLSMFACLFTREDREGLSLTGQRSLDRIKSISVKLEQLVTALHQLVTLDVTDEPVEDVDLLEVVGNARQRVSEAAMAGSVTLRCAPLPMVQGRRRQLMMLFHELFDNAVKFRKPDTHPRIDIECQLVQENSFRVMKDKYRYTDFARIVVADNGLGFDNRYSDYVFEVLRKVDTNTPGLGVGLALCHKVVENHGGSISVESEPGVGTRFTLLLPLRQ
ncbi:PAS domain S-box protein [Archangium violaceum]|uniref:sensor histidine kinase n=1 Tax=Archangium violaceum TaxID=83451 RepID=UPI00193AFCE9|nr:ATP-binding protein [Archangium violaceum]QRK09745.1 PAS domain S-box protein [Archangium violaceum]